ncbi:hypothetical protein CEE62_04610 [Stenotrophomonas maltophilia]|nr:hypothetical protein [Stenotrophomonas maltophilia]OWQ82059.1 hypothetical protein CEE62_04610 [Stenotrophomonas maltophilia]
MLSQEYCPISQNFLVSTLEVRVKDLRSESGSGVDLRLDDTPECQCQWLDPPIPDSTIEQRERLFESSRDRCWKSICPSHILQGYDESFVMVYDARLSFKEQIRR